MPLRTEADPPRQRRAPVALLILVVAVLLVVGAFGWSWFQPVALRIGGRELEFGYGSRTQPIYLIDDGYPTPRGELNDSFGPLTLRPPSGHINVPVPFTTETYWIWWY